MEIQKSLIVGCVAKYSVTKDVTGQGIVLDRIDMKNKITDTETVTGYMIQDEDTGEVKSVAYWRILSLVSSDENAPKKRLPGGYNPHDRHK